MQTTLKDKLNEICAKNTMQDTAYTLNSEGLKNDIYGLIQEALESLQGEEKPEWTSSTDGYVDLHDDAKGWNAREKKLREESNKFLGK